MSQPIRLEARRCPGKRRNRKMGTAARKPRIAAATILRSSASVPEMARDWQSPAMLRKPKSGKHQRKLRCESSHCGKCGTNDNQADEDEPTWSAGLPRSKQSFNPVLRRWLRDVDDDCCAGRALISRAVPGGHSVPLAMAGLHRRITNRGRGQQIRGEGLAPRTLLLASIDAVAEEVGFKIDAPGKINNNRARSGAQKHGSDQSLRCGGRKSVARRDRHWLRVRGFQFVAVNPDNAAYCVDVGVIENDGSVAVTVGFRETERRGACFRFTRRKFLRWRRGNFRMNLRAGDSIADDA